MFCSIYNIYLGMTEMKYEFIHVDREESYAVITLDRPALNLINEQMLMELINAFDHL